MLQFPVLLLQVTLKLSDVAAVIGIISSLIIALSAAVGVVWYIWRGKAIAQYEKEAIEDKLEVEEYRKKANEYKTERAEAKEELAKEKEKHSDTKRLLSDTESRLERSLDREKACEAEKMKLRGENEACEKDRREMREKFEARIKELEGKLADNSQG